LKRQQRRVTARGGRVDADGPLGREPQQVVRAASLRSGARQPFTAEGLCADDGADLIAVDINVADAGALADVRDSRVYPTVNPQCRPVTVPVNGINHRVEAVAAVTYDV
tara:strand:- start:5651 stop:5977 length:327 start_codon:yes stop_codon:yes gene_type:complete